MTFITKNDLDKMEDDLYKRVMISCYFSIATLTTIGYGDLYPVSTRERIFCIFIEICGMVFFSNIMGNFISIITTYHKRMGIRDYSAETNNWLTLLTRFTANQPLPKQLVDDINTHFQHYWANNRLEAVTGEFSPYLQSLPWDLKELIVVHYLFDDIFFHHRLFFAWQDTVDGEDAGAQRNQLGSASQFNHVDRQFLYDIAFGFKPRKYGTAEHEKLLLDEEQEVNEILFIQQGIVGVGFYHML